MKNNQPTKTEKQEINDHQTAIREAVEGLFPRGAGHPRPGQLQFLSSMKSLNTLPPAFSTIALLSEQEGTNGVFIIDQHAIVTDCRSLLVQKVGDDIPDTFINLDGHEKEPTITLAPDWITRRVGLESSDGEKPAALKKRFDFQSAIPPEENDLEKVQVNRNSLINILRSMEGDFVDLALSMSPAKPEQLSIRITEQCGHPSTGVIPTKTSPKKKDSPPSKARKTTAKKSPPSKPEPTPEQEPDEKKPATKATVSHNQAKNGLEISFDGIPSEEHRQLMKENSFRNTCGHRLLNLLS